ncbi:MAG TPA: RodZ domain-containing protein [Sphingomicrobium sp.]|nr:RodZ domain-containing protein [Sphingomicrobium sp.]
MPKREPDPEPIDEEQLEPEHPTVGERLRAAREKKRVSLEDIAAQTRIPRRHLESIEKAEWDSLPAPTYTIGFAKSYASAVGLERSEIGDQLREEMGGQRFASTSADVFEPADPRKTMPRGLVIGAIIAVVLLVVGMSWLNKRSLEQPESGGNISAAANETTPATSPRPAPPPLVPSTPKGPVVLTATAPVWLQISEKGGATLYSGTLQPNQTYTVPSTASAPVLKTGKPEALRVTVGSAEAPAVGPPATTVSNVSLLAPDLMKSAGVDHGPKPASSSSTSPSGTAGAGRAQDKTPTASPPTNTVP